MGFKNGDIVRFKTEDELSKIAKSIDLIGFGTFKLPSGISVNQEMVKKYCGKKVKVNKVYRNSLGRMKVDGHYEYLPNRWRWMDWNITTEMLVPINLNKRI